MANQIKIDAGLLSTASTGFKQDINDFLSKPYPLMLGQFSATDTVGTFAPFQLWKTITAIDLYKSKLKGGIGIRATIVLRIQMNGDRFMQGRYVLGLLPFVTSTQGTAAGDILASQNRQRQMLATKTTMTQLPRVEFDLNCDTEAIFEVPYVSPYSHYSLNSGHGDVGSIFLYPYVPLTTGTTGSTTCQYTIWCSFKDVEIVGPTLPQMAMGGPSSRPAGRVRKKGTVTEEEQRSSGMGPIESVLQKVSRAADVVGMIPVLTAVAKPVSWAADILAGAANVFGWSKPTNIAPPMRMQHSWAPFWNNPDSADYSQPLSMMVNNSLQVLPGFAGSNVDETSIDFVKTIPAWFTTVSWTTSNVNGDLLFQKSCAPGLYYNDASDGGATYRLHTPVAFLSTMFNNYRGSLRYTFKIVKTEFHSGRLVFSYAPRQVDTTTAFSLQDSTYLHREIIDVRLGNEFSFVVPYASVQQYRGVMDPYGSVQLNVLNQLTAPASVNSNIVILIEVSAAPDMEFAFPAAPLMTPHVPLVTQGNFEFQMGDEPECQIKEGMMSATAMFDDQLSAARFCVGEKVSSLMSFLKQSHHILPRASPGNFSNTSIFPYMTMRSMTNSDKTVTVTGHNADFYSLVMSCYGMSRGGVRIKCTPPASQLVKALLCKMKKTASPNDVLIYNNITDYCDLTTQNIGSFMRQVYSSSSAGIEVQIPQYHKFHSRLNSEVSPGLAPSFVNLNYPGVVDYFLWIDFGVTNTEINFYRSVADDFQLGYFCCVPPMVMNG